MLQVIHGAHGGLQQGVKQTESQQNTYTVSDWGVPGWLLRILASYLTNRSMILRYKNEQSTKHFLPGGGPQAVTLGLLMFLVEANDAGMDPLPPLPCPVQIGDESCIPAPPHVALSEENLRIKYVDDLSLAEVINLTDLTEKLIGLAIIETG